MRPSELTQFLARAIPARLPILIVGPPGCGKTDILGQVTDSIDYDLVVSHPVTSDQTKAEGLPWVFQSDGSPRAAFIPIGEMNAIYSATKPTVWAIDDIGQALPAVQAAFMGQLLPPQINGRRLAVNGHVFPECVSIVACSNRRTDRAGVSGILEPVKSRFAAIVELTVDLDDWCNWAFAHDVPAELVAFLRFKSDLLCAFTPSADLTNCPLPRTWAHVAKLLALGLPAGLQHQAIAGAVGAGAAVEFTAFLHLYAELPNIDGILLDPDKGKIPEQPAVLYSVVTALGMRTTIKNFSRIARYAERLTEAEHGEFAALLVRDCVRVEPGVMQTASFVRLAGTDLGQLVLGGSQ